MRPTVPLFFVAALLAALSLLLAGQSAFAEPYEQTVEGTTGLTHFWPMDESSGSSFADATGSADAEVSGGVTLGEPGGLVGGSSTAALFGGSGSAQAGVDLSGSGKLTVEFWMKWKAFANDDSLAMEFTPNFNEHAGGFLIDPNASDEGGTFAVGVGEGGSRNNVFFARPSAEAWHYYAFVIDTEGSGATEIKPYVDGHEVSYSKSASGSGGGFADSTLYWMSRDASSLFGSGAMQDLALYEGALSATAILEHYEIGEGGPKASFVSAPVAATVGVPVRLDASGSSSPAGSIADYAWDFDGSESYSSDAGGSATTSHTFSSPGTYTVDLRVEDSLGETATVSREVIVDDALGQYEQTVETTPGVSHFWPMGEASGSSFADLVDGADASVSGGVTLGEPGGLVGDSATAVLFDGSSGSAQAPVDLSGTGELTVEFWMKSSAFTDDDNLALEFTPNFNENAGGFLVDPNASDEGGTFAVGVGKGASRNNALFARPSSEQWHYYAFVIDTKASGGEVITPYVDGRPVSYAKTAEGTEGEDLADSTLYWMSRDASSLFGAGSMQDLALYDTTLSPTAIEEHYEVGEGGPKASFSAAPIVATAGVPVHLDASASTSPTGPITDYAWDFDGSETYASDSAESATTSHTFSTPGTYNVDLRVEDGLGETATVSREITVGAALGRYAQAVEDTAAVSHFWPMGETSGSTFADVFDGADATTSGGVSPGEPGGLVEDPSKSALFDGSSGAAQAPVDLSGTEKVTVEFWMKWKTFSDDDALALEFTPNFNEHAGGFLVDPNASDGGGTFGVGVGEGGSRNNVFFAQPSAEQWHYYAFVIDTEGSGATEITPYVDGHAVSYTKSASGTGGGLADSTLYWMSRDASSLFGSGAMQDLALYDGALDASTILTHYHRGEDTYKVANTAAPSIEGTAQDGQTFTASPGSWTGLEPISYAYQWQSCNATGGECEDIAGATATTYMLADDDVSRSVRVLVTASNILGSASVASAASARISPVAPVNTSPPSISGSALEGQTLSAGPGEWSGKPAPSDTFQWERCDSGGEACTDIAGATGATYRLGAVDVGATLRVRVVATNAASSATASSTVTSLVESTGAVAPSNTEPPSISGSPEDGRTLSAKLGAWEGTAPISYAYQWQSCDEEGANCEAIDGATNAKYTLEQGDEQTRLRVLVTASGSGGRAQTVSEATATVQAGAPSELEALSISGSPGVGEALYAETGAWDGSDVQFSYQWERCDEAGEECRQIPGAVEPEYVPGNGEVDETLRFRLGASNAEGAVTALSRASSPVQPSDVLLNTAAPTISGQPVSGGTLTANPGGWLGEATISYAYEWERCSLYGSECETIEEATGSTYSPLSADVGHTLRVRVSASEVEGAVSELSTVTAPVAETGAPLPEVAPSIAGTGLVGNTLTASAGDWSSAEAIAYSYQWVRCDEENEACTPISAATEDSYTLSEEDAGFAVRVLVDASNLSGISEAASTPIIASAQGITEIAQPSISGSDQPGRPLQASTGSWTGLGAIAFAYEWQRCDEAGESCEPIPTATTSAYSPTEADVGHTLRAKVTATGLEGPVNETSQATPPIGSEPTAPENTALPAVEGLLTVGETLSASAGSWSGSEPLTYTYQWQRCNQLGDACVEIEGASSDTYALTEADIGSSIRVLVGASNSAGSESAVSEASEEVGAAGPPANTQAPTITGKAVEGQQLLAENGHWSGSKSFIYYYRWERCNTTGEGCTPIEGATKPSYTLAAADVSATVRVNVTADNGLGSAGSISSPTEVVASATQAGTSAALEAIEATDPSLLASSTSANIEEQSLTPAIADSGAKLSSQSTLASSTISKATPGEFTLETADGPLSLTPVKPSLSAATLPTIANGVAALFAETWHESDTIVRPSALGAITLLQLRSQYAPTSVSWEIGIGANQQLEQLPDGAVAVVEPTPEASLESPLGEAGPSLGSSEASAQEEGEGFDAHKGEEELNGSLAEEGGLSPLPDSPTVSVAESTPKEHELHPQDTQEHYERDKSAMGYAEERTNDAALMVVEPPTVLDASGNPVPASLTVEGDTITLTVSPESEVAYPITAELASAAPTDLVSIARDPVKYGLSDPKTSVFENLKAGLTKAPLNIKVARDFIHYDAWKTKSSQEDVQKWLKAVGKYPNIKPYITITDEDKIPQSYEEYKEDVHELMAALVNGNKAEHIPAVKLWGAMNEPDLPPSGLTANPERAAIFWKIAEAIGAEVHCGCEIAAGEFHAHDSYIKKYIRVIVTNNSYTTTKPHVWGFHDYYDPENAQRHTNEHVGDTDLEKDLREIKGFPRARVWISETGVLLQNGTTVTELKTSKNHAKAQISAANDILKLAIGHSRVELVNYFLYEGPTLEYDEEPKHGPHSFDSALKAGKGIAEIEKQNPREAYCVLVLNKRKGCPANGTTKAPARKSVTTQAATIAANIEPRELLTTYSFEYGKTTAYGQTTSVTSLPSESGEQTVTAALGDLEPCTIYHYQVEVENEANEGVVSFGGDQTFETRCVRAVAVGSGHRCQLLADGSVECWGENFDGQLGDGTTESSSTPVPVYGITNAVAITAATNYSCATLAEGSAYCWGSNSDGQLGSGGSHTWSAVPVRVSGVSDAVDVVAAGREHACSDGSTGGVECWGADEVEQAPHLVEGLSGSTVGLGGGVGFTCALLATGHVQCWGENSRGELGDGTSESSASPVSVSGISAATSVTADGDGFACASLSDGGVDCWGQGYSRTPVQISGVTDAVAISGGEGFACALRSTGQVECWSYRGGLAVEAIPGITDATAIGASGEEACAVIAGEAVECWPEEEEEEPPLD